MSFGANSEHLIVWGLHDFIPEHDDEVPFRAGERIIVVERDDLYGDGWWRGTNTSGRTGLFPEAYTTREPPAGSPDYIPPVPPLPSNLTGGSSSGPLQSLAEESESVSGDADADDANEPASKPKPDFAPTPIQHEPGTVMHATMTDIQEAIEQLGVNSRNDLDTTSRSFSFASTTRDEDDRTTTEDAESEDDEPDEYGGTSAGWRNKEARKKLAENVNRQNLKAAASSASHRPPIEVEMSDESEDEGGDNTRNYLPLHITTPSPDRAEHSPTSPTPSSIEVRPKEDEAFDMLTPMPPGSANTATTFLVSQQTPTTAKGHSRQGSELTIAQPTPQLAQAIIPRDFIEPPIINEPSPVASPESLPIPLSTPSPKASPLPLPTTDDIGETPTKASTPIQQTATSTRSVSPPIAVPIISPVPQALASTSSQSASPQSVPLPMSIPSSPAPPPTTQPFPQVTPTILKAPINPPSEPTRPDAPTPPPQPSTPIQPASPSTNLSVSVNATGPPAEWSVEQVVAWLRSKGFDDSVCGKFIENDITGDVLLELDVNTLKEEIGIAAFGKRMRIANSIAELRRPPSVNSSSPSVRTPNHQHTVFSSGYGGSSRGTGSTPHSMTLYSPESAPHTGDMLGTPSMDRFPVSPSHAYGYTYVYNGPPTGGTTTGHSSMEIEKTLLPVEGPDGKGIVGLGITKTVVTPGSPTSIDRNRAMTLSLSPSDSALNTRAGWGSHAKQKSGGSSIIAEVVEEEDLGKERGALTDGETVSVIAKREGTKLRKGFGRSAATSRATTLDSSVSASSTNITASTSTATTSSAATTIPPSPSKSKAKSKANGDTSGHSKKKSLDSVVGERKSAAPNENRHSFFGGTLGKSRKPAPRYSEVSQSDTSPTEKGSTFSRLISTGTNRRPRTSQGSTPPISTLAPESDSTRKRTLSATDVTLASPRSDPSSSPGRSPLSATEKNSPPDLKPGAKVLEQIGTPDHEGWMRKKGEKYNTWKLRYFVLKGPHLYYLRSRAETKIKGYINIKGYRIIADENTNPGRYGFRIMHDSEAPHYFSSEEQLAVREWMKALMKATIARDYTQPVVSSVNIPTIPLSVAQAMSPAPRPPSPTARDATQRALRRENPNQLSTRDARVLMGNLPDEERNKVLATANNAPPALTPVRPSRESRRTTESGADLEWVEWINDHIPDSPHKATDLSSSLATGLILFRLAESIKGGSGNTDVPDAQFPTSPADEKLDGLFALFDFLLDNDVRIGSVSINDVRQGNKDKLLQLVKALKAWEDKRVSIEKGAVVGGRAAVSGQFVGVA